MMMEEFNEFNELNELMSWFIYFLIQECSNVLGIDASGNDLFWSMMHLFSTYE